MNKKDLRETNRTETRIGNLSTKKVIKKEGKKSFSNLDIIKHRSILKATTKIYTKKKGKFENKD